MKLEGGDITEIVCKHPDLGDFRFQAKSNESYTVDFGGFRNNDDANGLTGSGELINQKNRVRWSFEGPIISDFTGSTNQDLNDLAESSTPGIWIFNHISGAIWKGKGIIVGDLQTDTNNAQITTKLSGGGKLEVQ